ncbi:MAG: Na+:solute symporter, partial [Cyclobacteriaceae bacterium]|nr:Na+:solute symporter [Cyclobacteriaceae bacterium HetDA_MAG_MS6]
MGIATVDIAIVAAYLLMTVLIGFYISKNASKNLDSYFLGGKNIPWYFLGISNASGMFDITGTMWMVYLCYVYGLKSIWIPWLWPVFNQIFLMVYMSAWLRKSNVLTGAEWIKTRFGSGRGAELSHIIVVVFAVVGVIGFLSYGFKGVGKFASVFFPYDLSPNTYGLIFMGITTLYVIKGGMYSVVFTELLQFLVMFVASIAVGVIAIRAVSPEALAAVTPSGWDDIFFGWRLDLNWSELMPQVNESITNDGWGIFGWFFIMMLFKGILVSAAGPAPNFDMQRILATKTPAEASKMSGFVNVVLIFPRYFLIAGLTVLALVFMKKDLLAMGSNMDFEMILPLAIQRFLPAGLTGLLLAGLIAAFMSTFASTVNAAPAYLVNDIYKKYINPHASDRKYIKMSYLASFAVVAVGISFGFMAESISSVTLWLVSGLWGGYTAANVLKWYWWRFNGHGYFWGMAGGIIASLLM